MNTQQKPKPNTHWMFMLSLALRLWHTFAVYTRARATTPRVHEFLCQVRYAGQEGRVDHFQRFF
jgi:hypothetical protein